MKDPKKVEAGKRLAASNRKRREAKKAKKMDEFNQYYGIGVMLAVGVIGGLGYYIYQSKKSEATGEEQPSNPQQNNPPNQPNKFEM